MCQVPHCWSGQPHCRHRLGETDFNSKCIVDLESPPSTWNSMKVHRFLRRITQPFHFMPQRTARSASVIKVGINRRLCLRGQQFVINWGPQGVEARIIDAHPLRFADPQDDSIFHPRTWHWAARLGQVSFHRLQRSVRWQSRVLLADPLSLFPPVYVRT